jgi:hypothetical protein
MTKTWQRVALGLALMTALSIVAFHRQSPVAMGGQEAKDQAFKEEARAIEVENERSKDDISIRQLNEFHLAIIGRLLERMESEEAGHRVARLNVEYGGILSDHGTVWYSMSDVLPASENGNQKSSDGLTALFGRSVRIGGGDIGHPLLWTITDRKRLPLFSFWISKRKTSLTVAECDIPSGHLFVNVGGQPGDLADVDNPKPELGGLTQRQVLKLLEAGLSDLEKPEAEEPEEEEPAPTPP